VILAVIAMTFVVRVEIDSDTGSFLDRSDPAWGIYQSSVAEYGGDEFLAIAIEGERPFDPEVLARVADLTFEFERLEGVRRVDSLASVPVIGVDGSGVLDLRPGLRPEDRETEFIHVRDRIRNDRISPRSLVSGDGRVLAINLLLHEDVDSHREDVVSAVETLIANDRAWLSGVPVFRTRVNSVTQSELFAFVPVVLFFIAIVVYVAYRSLIAIAISLLTSGLAAIGAIGAMGALGVPISLSTVTLPPILLAVGSAYSMHILSAGMRARNRVDLQRSIGEIVRPVAISGLTTAIGFLAMASVRITAIRDLGTYGAIGVLLGLSAALTVGPALLSTSIQARRPEPRIDVFVDRFSPALVRFVLSRRRGIITGWVLIVAIASIGISRLEVETDIILWFEEGNATRDDYELIRSKLSGITPMNVVIESMGSSRVTEPQVLERIDSFSEYLNDRPDVGKALSVVDPLRQIHESFDNSSRGDLPGSRQLVEQYLLLLASVDQMRDVVSNDRLGANVVIRADVNGSRALVGLARSAESWWDSHGAPGFSASATGIMYEFGRAEEAIAYGQLQGLLLAFAAVGAILFAVFRSAVMTCVALIPNTLPIIVAYGVMGGMGLRLDAATVCVGAIALGIAVDDTVHVAVGFRESQARGLSPSESLSAVLRRVLGALVLTTIAIVFGFSVLSISSFVLIRNFGVVTAGMIGLCLLADLTLLPILLRAVGDAERTKGRGAQSSHDRGLAH
jgi:predicted RND superfamily exporter protein